MKLILAIMLRMVIFTDLSASKLHYRNSFIAKVEIAYI